MRGFRIIYKDGEEDCIATCDAEFAEYDIKEGETIVGAYQETRYMDPLRVQFVIMSALEWLKFYWKNNLNK